MSTDIDILPDFIDWTLLCLEIHSDRMPREWENRAVSRMCMHAYAHTHTEDTSGDASEIVQVTLCWSKYVQRRFWSKTARCCSKETDTAQIRHMLCKQHRTTTHKQHITDINYNHYVSRTFRTSVQSTSWCRCRSMLTLCFRSILFL